MIHYHAVGDALSNHIGDWMYATPVVYAMSIIPERSRAVYRINPMTNVIEGFRWALLGSGHAPDIFLLISAILVAPFLIAGAFYFRRTERTIVDIA